MVRVIGLTGQSGAGKTTASKIFAESGFAIIDADKCSREVVLPGSPCLKKLCEYFGEKIKNTDGSLNRALLAEIVFSDKNELEKMGTIMYPYITNLVCEKIKDFGQGGHEYVLLDAPTLFESKADKMCDLIVSIIAEEDVRKNRIVKRDGVSEEAALRRISAQHSEEFFIKHSDYIITNNDSLSEFNDKVREVVDKVKHKLRD